MQTVKSIDNNTDEISPAPFSALITLLSVTGSIKAAASLYINHIIAILITGTAHDTHIKITAAAAIELFITLVTAERLSTVDFIISPTIGTAPMALLAVLNAMEDIFPVPSL